MSVTTDELNILQNKVFYGTTNEKHVLSQDFQKYFVTPEYKVLGFLNEYMYSFSDGYLIKSTLNGDLISQVLIDIEHGAFYEGLEYFYVYKEKTMYRVNIDLSIEWSLVFDDYIRAITVDTYGSTYVIFKNSRTIRKFLNTGANLLFLTESDDVTKKCRLYKVFVTPGTGFIYVIGSQFYDNKVDSFIDKYDTRKGKRIERSILCSDKNIIEDDSYYSYHNIIVNGDYIYIYANQYIQKINLKMINIWKYFFAMNTETGRYNELSNVEFDDSKYEDYIYFVEDLYETKGHSFGKLTTNGKLLWKISYKKSIRDTEFNVCIYQDKIYTVSKIDILLQNESLLSLNNNNLLFETKDGVLIRIVEDGKNEIYNSAYYNSFQLVFDKIKDGIPKEIDIQLLHNTGPVIDELGNPLLIHVENYNYTNPENYNYSNAIASELTDLANAISKINTYNGLQMQSFNDSDIVTAEAYGYELVDGRYDNAKFLLADKHKFFTNIITKDKGFTIITKTKGHSITKKIKSFYNYVLNKLTDIDIIVEFLKQGKILETLLPEYVEKLKHHTTSMITDIQKSGSPVYFDIMPTKKFNYTLDGYEYPIRFEGVQIYMCRNIPYNNKRLGKASYMDSMANMVKKKEIRPFLLFLGGRAIKWSNVVIVRDWYYSYIMISNIEETNYRLEAVMFPCDIRYGEDNNLLLDKSKALLFDSNGLYTENIDDVSIRIEITDSNVSCESHVLTVESPYLNLSTNYDQYASDTNILAFENNKFFGDSRFYLQNHNRNVFTYLRDHSKTKFKAFYYKPANTHLNLLSKLPESTTDDIKERITNPSIHTYVDNFSPTFDFKMSKKKTYDTNIAEAISYIMSYDMALLANYYKNQMNMVSFVYTGERILELASKNAGFLIMSRQRCDGLGDYVVMFKNGKLFDYYKEIEYGLNTFKIPIFSHVSPTDTVEIIHYKNVDNNYYSFTVQTDRNDYLSSNLRYDNFLLYGNSYTGDDTYDDWSVENNRQYKLDFSYRNIFDSMNKYTGTEISLVDQYYVGKQINIASKRQFQHMYYNVLINNQTSFELDPTFRFCQTKSQYMIFINNTKLRFDDWTLSVMTNENRIDYITIVLNTALNIGDVIEIIYVPDSYEELYLDNYNSSDGTIIIDKSILEYPFEKDIFHIYTNGNKINPRMISNISKDKIRLMEGDYSSGVNVTILRYLEADKLLKKLFSYSDMWSNSVDALSPEEYHKLFVMASKK